MSVFLDTSVLLAGLVDFGPQSAPAQSLLHAVAEQRIDAPATAWHCCLEFFSVALACPPSSGSRRPTPSSCCRMKSSGGWPFTTCRQDRLAMLRTAARDTIVGGRIYDAHIAEVARAAGAIVVVTDNRRHFLSALRYGLRVETPTEFLTGLKKKPR